jgi:Caspase domain
MIRSFTASCLTVSFGLLVLAPLDSTPCAAAEPAVNSPRLPPGKVHRHALLIGCTDYPKLDKKFWLQGPGNDVQLMAKALRELFGFLPESITILSDEVARVRKDDNFLPTKANIKREFERLAQVAKEGDKVVILIGGHGSTAPEGENPPNPNPEGMSTIFLPRDVGKWDESTGEVKNAIVDHEFAAWLAAIQNTRATIWLTVDACHSGSISRDIDPHSIEKSREIDSEVGLGISRKAIVAAVERAKQRNGGPVKGQSLTASLSNKPGLVAIYAAKENENTIERDMPPKSRDAKPHSLLTYTLVQAIQQANEKSSQPLTYRQLVHRIQSQYFAWGRTYPTPLVEGVDSDREVLGEKEWPARSSITLARGDKALKVTGGNLCGLTPGTILAVFPPPGQGNNLLGHVRVTEVRMLESDVEPFSFEKTPVVEKLPTDGTCQVVYVDRGDPELTLGLDPKWMDGREEKILDKKEQERLLKALAKLNRPRPGANPNDPTVLPLVKLVNDPAQADWIVRPYKDGTKLVMAPAADLINARLETPRHFGPYLDDDKLVMSIAESAEKIARFENLKKLAAGFADKPGGQGISFKMEMRRAKDKTDKEGTYPIPWPATDLTFYDKDCVVFKTTNTGQTPIDLTFLYLDSDYNIVCIYPKELEFNRLDPGRTLKFRPLTMTTHTDGMEYLVVIAVKGENQNVNFAYLQQPGLTLARGLGKQTTRDLPLGQMFQKAMYNDGNTRGLKITEVDDYAMTMLSWTIKPGKRPANKPAEE